MNVTGVVLAAGFGTRLRPSTEFCPKPLIPVAGVEPLFHALNQLSEIGVKDVVINAHYLPEKINAALVRWKKLLPNLRMHLSVEKEILGTGGAIQKILKDFPKLFENKGLMLLNGDTFARIPSTRLFNKKDSSTFAYSSAPEHLQKYKPLWMGRDSSWHGIGPKAPKTDSKPVHFLGVHFLCAKDVAWLSKNLPSQVEFVDLFNGIYRPLCTQGAIIEGVEMLASMAEYSDSLYWFDMTNGQYLLEAQHFLLGDSGPGSDWQKFLKSRFPNIKETAKGVWVDATFSDGLKFISPSIFVDSNQGTFKKVFPGVELGPHASLICEGICLSFDKTGNKKVLVKNSVLFLTENDREKTQTPELIQDEVRVW